MKEYLLRGYVVNTRIAALEQHAAKQDLEIQELKSKVDFFVPITVCQHNHDRFLIIDDKVYVFGASLKDAGKRLFAYIWMHETSAQDLLNGIR